MLTNPCNAMLRYNRISRVALHFLPLPKKLSEWLHERTEHLGIFLLPAHHSVCSISDVLFTGGRGMSDFSVLKY